MTTKTNAKAYRFSTDDTAKFAESVAAALGCRVSDLFGETEEAPSGQ